MSYPSGPFTPPFIIGGSGGYEWSSCGWITNKKAALVKNLAVWWDSGELKAVQIHYADESISSTFGQRFGDGANIAFAPGEQVTSLTLWGNGNGKRAGRIRITTNKGQIFDKGKDTSGQTPYSAPIGSGILVGMVGWHDSSLDSLGAVFLNASISSVSIGDIQYADTLDGTKTGLSQVALGEVHYKGAPGTGTNYEFADKVERTASTSFSQTSSIMYGMNINVSVSAKLFGIGGSVDTGFQWQITDTQETTTPTSTLTGLTWSTSGHAEPGKGVTCTSLSQMGIGNANYNSTVTIKLSNGDITSYTEPGIFSNVVYTAAWVTEVPGVGGKPRVLIEGPRPPPT